MKKTHLLYIFILLTGLKGFSQPSAISLLDKEIKVSPSDSVEFYYAFAKGDKLFFNLYDINAPDIVEGKITEYPSIVVLKRQKLQINFNFKNELKKKSIYRFTIFNTGKTELICKLKIQRIPSSSKTKDFLTNVIWKDKMDTTYKTIAQASKTIYDTTITSHKSKVLVKTERTEKMLIDKKVKLGNAGKKDSTDKAVMLLQLPNNINTKLLTRELVTWSYWIGTGKESEEAYSINEESFKKIKSVYKTPLAAYSVGEMNELKIPKKGDVIEYYFINNGKDADAFMINKEFGYVDKGKAVAGFGSSNIKQGNFFICFKNINIDKEVEAAVKIDAVFETKTYEFRETKNTDINKELGKSTSTKQMIIKTLKIPTFAE